MKPESIGQVKKLMRFPIKSMAGIELDTSELGWHGFEGDRRFGVRRLNESGDFPWLTASRLPELLLYHPIEFHQDSLLPMRVRTPNGRALEINGDDLSREIGELFQDPVELMAIKHGIFDDSVISIIGSATASHVCAESGVACDSRRFRANIELNLDNDTPFLEDDWVGRVIAFGDPNTGPAVFVKKRDVRCKMIGLDPDSAEHNPAVVKAAVQLNENNAGVYCNVIRTGCIGKGDPVFVEG